MQDIQSTLAERGSRYGEFADVARVTSQIVNAVFDHRPTGLSDVQKVAVNMIANKLARIACGDPGYADSWRDIAGYAELVVADLTRPGAFPKIEPADWEAA